MPLPAYLDRCPTSQLYHSHPTLRIVISGTNFPIPSGVGMQGSCNRPLHTHDPTGTIHVETDDDRTYTLADFLTIWGNWANDKNLATFNSTQIFNNRADATHNIALTVNGASPGSTAFATPGHPESLLLPRDAGTRNPNPPPQWNCSPAPQQDGPCSPFDILITYGITYGSTTTS